MSKIFSTLPGKESSWRSVDVKKYEDDVKGENYDILRF